MKLSYPITGTRTTAIDAWKGCAIIAVIAIHACNWALESAISTNHYHAALARCFLNFAVPLFFGISGFLCPDLQKIRSAGGVGKFYKERLIRLWTPYILWTLLYVLLRDREQIADPCGILSALILGTGIGVGYFVVVLTLFTLLHPVLAQLLTPKRLLRYSFFATLASLGLLYYVRIHRPDALLANYPYNGLLFTLWIWFFYLGYYIRCGGIQTALPKSKVFSLLSVGLFLSALESLLILKYIGSPFLAAGQAKLSAFVYASAVLLAVLRWDVGRIGYNRVLVWLGQRSYVLYLCHMLFLGATFKLIAKFEGVDPTSVLWVPVATTCVLVCAGVCVYGVERFAPGAVITHVLGLRGAVARKGYGPA